MAIVTFDAAKVIKTIGEIPRGPARRAIVRGLNKTAQNVSTSANSAIRQRRSLPARTVREAMRIKKATNNNLVSSIVVTGRPIPLRDYAARQTRQGVTVSVTPGKRKLVTHNTNNSFLIQKLGGHAFAREGKGRLPVKKLFGPSLPATFIQEQVKSVWTATAIEAMPKRLAEEVRFELSRLSKV